MKENISILARRVSLLYATVAALWILFSDRLLEIFIQDAHALSLAQTVKGWLFVAATALMLYWVIRREQSTDSAGEMVPPVASAGRFYSSLGVRLMGLVLLALVPPLCLLVLDGIGNRHREEERTREDTMRLARFASQRQDRLFEAAHQLLTLLADLPAVREGNPEACSALFHQMQVLFPHYVNIWAVRLDGEVFASALPLEGQLNVSQRSWFERALRKRDFVIGEYESGHAVHRPVIVCADPVRRDDGSIRCIISVELDLEWLTRFAAEAQLPAGSVMNLIDRQGTILARTLEPEKWVGKRPTRTAVSNAILMGQEGIVQAVGVDGVERIYAIDTVRSTQGTVFVTVGIPIDAVHALGNQILKRGLMSLAVIAVLALAASWLFAELFVLRHTRALALAASRLRGGDLKARSAVSYDAGELGHLARTFDEMAQSLEQRNTEQVKAETALQNSSRFNQQIVNSAQEGIIVFDRDCRYRVWNPYMERMTGTPAEKVIGYLPWEAFPFLLKDGIGPMIERALAGESFVPPEGEYIVPQTGKRGWESGSFAPLRNNEGEIVGAICTVRDITPRKRAEQALRESEERLRSIAQNAPAYIYELDREGRILFANRTYDGISQEQVIGTAIAEWLPPDRRAAIQSAIERVFELGTVQDIEYSIPNPQKETRHYSTQIAPIRMENRVVAAVLIANDITERRRAEGRLRRSREALRALSIRLQDLREEERTRISREIHDQLGQALTGLKMDLRWLEKRLENPAAHTEALQEKILSMSDLTDATIQTVQRISYELRPGILDNLGLVAALRHETKAFEQRYNIHCELALTDEPLDLNRDRSTAAFRIFQETLTNVARHADASQICIRLQRNEGVVVMEISDNGKGIHEEQLTGAESIGLLGMRERAASVGGTLEIRGEAGQGTKVKLMIPIKETV